MVGVGCQAGSRISFSGVPWRPPFIPLCTFLIHAHVAWLPGALVRDRKANGASLHYRITDTQLNRSSISIAGSNTFVYGVEERATGFLIRHGYTREHEKQPLSMVLWEETHAMVNAFQRRETCFWLFVLRREIHKRGRPSASLAFYAGINVYFSLYRDP